MRSLLPMLKEAGLARQLIGDGHGRGHFDHDA